MILFMAFCWVLDLMNMNAVALIPVVLCPLFGLVSTGAITKVYLKASNMLIIATMLVSVAVETTNLHRRIALNLMRLVGSTPSKLMASFMLPTALLSMWISDTGTAVTMMPMVEAVLGELRDQPDKLDTVDGDNEDEDEFNWKAELKKIRAMLCMTVSYSALIGGTATIIGTPPNLLLLEFMEPYEGQPINFSSWMAFAMPQVLLCLVIIWLVLQTYFIGFPVKCGRKNKNKLGDLEGKRYEAVADMVHRECDALGPMKFNEWLVSAVFSMLLILWFFRSPGYMTGWGDLFDTVNALGEDVEVGDATAAVFAALLLFILPSEPFILDKLRGKRPDFESSPAILDWKVAEKKVHWGVVLLIGAGYALSEASDSSCLSSWIGYQLEILAPLPTPLIAFIASLIAAVVTQITSNTASAGMLLPILLELSFSLEINPLYLMLPVTFTCSYAFMLPVSTGPNAIAFGPSGMKTVDMMKLGAIANLLCLGAVTLCVNTYGIPLFDLKEFPDWAQGQANATNPCGY